MFLTFDLEAGFQFFANNGRVDRCRRQFSNTDKAYDKTHCMPIVRSTLYRSRFFGKGKKVGVTFGDSLDLGIAVAALMNGAVSEDEISKWAARVIDEMVDPPIYIYTMLDLANYQGRGVHDEIGFAPSTGLETEEEFQYLREIAVIRGLQNADFLAGKKKTSISAPRKAYVDRLLNHNFGFDVSSVSRLPRSAA